jgi:hypothetical protein
MDVWEESLSPLLRACRDGDGKLCAILLETEFAAAFSLDAMGGNAVYWAVVSANKVMLNDIIRGGVSRNNHENNSRRIAATRSL